MLWDNTFNVLNYTALSIFTLLCLYPFYYILVYSLSDPRTASSGLLLFPKDITLFNYIQILQVKEIYSATFISVLRTVIGTIITVFCSSIFAYVLTKDELYFRKIIYRFMIITMYISAGLIPYYIVIKTYGLRNSFLVYIIPSAISAFFVILIKTFMEQLPASLEESAMLDGAGYFTIFIRIVFPLCMPIVATVLVFAAVGNWNSWFDTYIFIQDKKLFTLQYILLNYLQESQKLANLVQKSTNSSGLASAALQVQVTPESARMTITMIAIIPIFLVYPFMQRHFVKGIMMGAIKG